ncbi:papl [Symbiodinium sp. CCMP2456]|nr:papl [Symbiodinium sp. CCMP2456]
MTVHWSTMQESYLRNQTAYDPGDSFVMYGLSKDALTRTSNGTSFLFQDYGDEHRNFTMHIATMTDLLPNKIYYYVVGGVLLAKPRASGSQPPSLSRRNREERCDRLSPIYWSPACP